MQPARRPPPPPWGPALALSLLAGLLAAPPPAAAAQRGLLHVHMPAVHPQHDDSYLCTAKRLDPAKEQFIVGFEPDASASRVHHMIVHACERPGRLERDSPRLVWECGEMDLAAGHQQAGQDVFERGQPCEQGAKQTMVFAWALDAPPIELEAGVGFRIGLNSSGLAYLVLQVHYGNAAPFRAQPRLLDSSGIRLHTLWGPQHGISRQAGIYLLLSYGSVRPGLSRHNMTCRLDEDKRIHPFRFRTHTHKLGLEVAAFRVRQGRRTLVGRHDPQQPQMFYHVHRPDLELGPGDVVDAYCLYNNTRGHEVLIGPTGNHEMCNFYMMYWTEGELLRNPDCFQYNS